MITPDGVPVKESGSEKRLRYYCEMWRSVSIRMGGRSRRNCVESRETSTMKQSCRRLWRREQEVQTQHGKTQSQPKKDIVTPKSNYVLSIIWITSAEISQVVYPLHHHLNSLWKQRFLYVCHWNQYLLLNNFCFIPSTITYFLVSEFGLLTVHNFLQ